MEATTATSTTIRRAIAAGAAALLLLAACGDDGDAGSGAPTGSEDTGTDDGSGGSGDSGGGGESSGGGTGSGTLTFDGEAIELSMQCFLESQPSAGGGGNILFVVQGQGTNAAGDAVVLDVSRYDEESAFAGDDITVTVGDPLSGEAADFGALTDTGAVTLDGSSVSADDQLLLNTDTGEQVAISFDIDC